jgi:hypothetical protein
MRASIWTAARSVLRLELLPFYRNLGFSETGTEEFQPSRQQKGGEKMPLNRNV